MNNASTADGRGQDRPNDGEPFFPSEGAFNPVVPLSEIGRAPAPAPLSRTDGADAGRPAEAAWAREAHRPGWKDEEETTLVPARGVRGVQQSWAVTATVIVLSVAAGLASGTYLIWSSRRAPEPQTPAQVAAEAPTLQPAPATDATPAPAAVQEEANTKVEKVNETVRDETPREVAKAGKPSEAPRAPKEAPQPERPANAARAERTTRESAEAREVTPAPKPARTQSAAPSRPRVTTAAKQPPAPSERSLPISAPPSNARSRKVIQWP
jgi:hypothetical protein